MKLLISLALASTALSMVPNLETYHREGWYRAAVGHNGFKGVMWFNKDTLKIEMNFNKKPAFDEFKWWKHAVTYADQHHVEDGVSGFDTSKLGPHLNTESTSTMLSVTENEYEDGTYTFEGSFDSSTIDIFDTVTLSEDGSDPICGGTFVYGQLKYHTFNHDQYQAIVYEASPRAFSVNIINFNNPTFYQVNAYGQADCGGGLVKTIGGAWTSINEWTELQNSPSDILSVKFYDLECHNLDMGKALTNYVQLNAPGIRMRFKQNSIFEPTYYWLDYNQMKSQSDEALGGYHVHKWPLPDSEIGSPNWGNAGCGDTGGHWNPYDIQKPPTGFEAGREQEYYEIGDLSSKFGSLVNKTRYKGYWSDFNLPLFGINNIEQRSVVFHAASGGARKLCYNLRNSRMGERNHAHFINSFTRDEGGMLLKLSLYQPGWDSPTALHVYTETDDTVTPGEFDVHLHEGMCSGVTASGHPGSLNTANFKNVEAGVQQAKGGVTLRSASLLTNNAYAYIADSRSSMIYKTLAGIWKQKDTMYSLVLVDDNGDNVGCFDLYKPVKPVMVSENGQFTYGSTCLASKKKMKGNFGGIRAQACKSKDSKQVFYNDNGWRIRMNNNDDSCITAKGYSKGGRIGLATCKNGDAKQMWAYNDKGRISLATKPNMCIRRKGKKILMSKC